MAIQRGVSVSFNDHKGRKLVGVAVNMVGRRWCVRTEGGQTWRVPEVHLKEEKPTKQAEKLLAAGDGFLAERSENREKYKAAKADSLSLRVQNLARGQHVQVYTSHFGWRNTRIVKVEKEKGKVTVLNPKHLLAQEFAPLLHKEYDTDMIDRFERMRQTITVWADRIREVR